MTALELRKRRKALLDDASALVATATTGGRDLTDDEAAKVDAAVAESKKLETQIDRLDLLGAETASLGKAEPRRTELSLDNNITAAGDVVRKRAKRLRPSGKLKAFTGEGGEEEAYRFGMWYAAVKGMPWGRKFCEREGIDFQAALGEGAESGAGIMVPLEFSQRFIDLREEYGVLRGLAYVEPMTSETALVKRRVSGITWYAVGENPASEVTKSDPKFDGIQLTAKLFMAATAYSKQLSEDAIISIADRIMEEMAYAWSNKEDTLGFNGNGLSTDQGHGVIGLTVKINDGNHAGSIATAAAGHVTYATIDSADMLAVEAKLPEYAVKRGTPVWMCSRPFFVQVIQRLKFAAGGNTSEDLGRGAGMEFHGYPVVISQVLNSAAAVSTITALFGDPKLACTIGDRNVFGMSINPYLLQGYDQDVVYARTRWDFNAHDLGDGSTGGPVIALKTPAS